MSDTATINVDMPQKPKASRRLWTVLIASLALNLLMMGAIGGTFWRFRHGQPPFGPMAFVSMSFLHHLPAERRKSLSDVLAKFRDFRWQSWRQLKIARDAAGQALVAEPFDPNVLEDRLRTMQRGELAMRDDFIPMLVEVAKALTPDERQDLLRQLRRGDRGRPSKR